MSVTNRIRLVGATASSIAVAVVVLVVSSIWASVDALPGILAVGSAGALMGVVLTTTIGVALVLSVNANDRRRTLGAEAKRPLQ